MPEFAGSATVPMGTQAVGSATVLMEENTRGERTGTAAMPAQNFPAQEQKKTQEPQTDYGPISMATDIYAIGATLYFAVTGRNPEKSLGNVTPLGAHKPQISRSMQTIIVRAMHKQQNKRFRQAENCYASAVEKYRQAQANGTEDTQMAVLKNLIDQLRTSGWLK